MNAAIGVRKGRCSWQLRVGAAVLGVLFIVEGLLKFTPGATDMFDDWGYPGWFTSFIGAAQVLVGALLFWPAAIPVAAVALSLLMLGALGTLLLAGETHMVLVPALLFIYSALLAWRAKCSLWNA
jgi:uncharacterized membrane protein YphA (DoxX/SURF4 family)